MTIPQTKQVPLVRVAVPEDWQQIIQMCEELHAENGAASVDWPTVEAIIAKGINKDGAMIGVIGPVNAIKGITYLKFSKLWYSEDIFLEELFLYVRPEHRRSDNAKLLLKFARESAKRLKVPLLIGVISNERTKAKLGLYARQLGAPVGGFFFLER
jgi:GNAT superfamily N-acetyltransferase